MPTPWDAAIRKSKQLTVFPGDDLKKAPAWGLGLFQRLLDEFNRLSKSHSIGLTLIASNTKPDPNTDAGANVQIEVSPGTHTFTVQGTTHTDSLPATALDIVGRTRPAIQGGEIIRAFIFVPITPSIQGTGSRGVGIGVKLSLALHEVIHACGLRESDPGHNKGQNDPDLFMTAAQLEANFPPDGIPGDRLNLGHGRFSPPKGGLSPLEITGRTAGLLRENWK